MDHQAFAQLLGNYGEFIGAIAVLVTLAYLAVQVRHNTRSMQSQILLQTTQLLQGVFLAPSHATPLQAAICANREGKKLEPEEMVALAEYLYAYMHALGSTGVHFELGGLRIYSNLHPAFLDDVRDFLSTPNLEDIVKVYDARRGGDALGRMHRTLISMAEGTKVEEISIATTTH
jgi:hypothetical protein